MNRSPCRFRSPPPRLGAGLLAAVFATVLVAPPASGQVRDEGQLFRRQTVEELEEIAEDVEQRLGRRLVIETYAEIPMDLRRDYDEARKVQFFEKWVNRRGRASRADVIILICTDPRHLRVDASPDAERDGAFTDADVKAVADPLVREFRARRFDAGILAAARSVRERIANNTGADRAKAAGPRLRRALIGTWDDASGTTRDSYEFRADGTYRMTTTGTDGQRSVTEGRWQVVGTEGPRPAAADADPQALPAEVPPEGLPERPADVPDEPPFPTAVVRLTDERGAETELRWRSAGGGDAIRTDAQGRKTIFTRRAGRGTDAGRE